jgi:Lanthionine-containing peptide SapB precursor RamS
MSILDLQDMKVTETVAGHSHKGSKKSCGGGGGGGQSGLSLLLC